MTDTDRETQQTIGFDKFPANLLKFDQFKAVHRKFPEFSELQECSGNKTPSIFYSRIAHLQQTI